MLYELKNRGFFVVSSIHLHEGKNCPENLLEIFSICLLKKLYYVHIIHQDIFQFPY